MRCTEVAGRPFPDGKFTCRDIGDRGRYAFKRYDTTRRHIHVSRLDYESTRGGRPQMWVVGAGLAFLTFAYGVSCMITQSATVPRVRIRGVGGMHQGCSLKLLECCGCIRTPCCIRVAFHSFSMVLGESSDTIQVLRNWQIWHSPRIARINSSLRIYSDNSAVVNQKQVRRNNRMHRSRTRWFTNLLASLGATR